MNIFPQPCKPVFNYTLPVFDYAATSTMLTMGFVILHLGRPKEGDWLEESAFSRLLNYLGIKVPALLQHVGM